MKNIQQKKLFYLYNNNKQINTTVYIRGPVYKTDSGEIRMSDRKNDVLIFIIQNMSISVMEKIENSGRFEGRNGKIFFIGLSFLISSITILLNSKK